MKANPFVSTDKNGFKQHVIHIKKRYASKWIHTVFGARDGT